MFTAQQKIKIIKKKHYFIYTKVTNNYFVHNELLDKLYIQQYATVYNIVIIRSYTKSQPVINE